MSTENSSTGRLSAPSLHSFTHSSRRPQHQHKFASQMHVLHSLARALWASEYSFFPIQFFAVPPGAQQFLIRASALHSVTALTLFFCGASHAEYIWKSLSHAVNILIIIWLMHAQPRRPCWIIIFVLLHSRFSGTAHRHKIWILNYRDSRCARCVLYVRIIPIRQRFLLSLTRRERTTRHPWQNFAPAPIGQFANWFPFARTAPAAWCKLKLRPINHGGAL